MLRTQPNAWIHSLLTITVIGLSVWLDLTSLEWALIVVAIGLVWTTEFINTALEATVDLVSPNIHPLAKIAKDVMAGAVLAAAITSALIGLLVLGPPLLARLLPLLTP